MTNAQAADSQARLCVLLRDITEFFEIAGCSVKSIQKLNDYINSQEYSEFLELSEGFSKCMAFIDHDELIAKLYAGWTGVEEGLLIERKIVSRKLRNLEGDKNADPDVITRLHNHKADVDQRLAKVTVQKIKFSIAKSIPIQKFYDKHFDPALEALKSQLNN